MDSLADEAVYRGYDQAQLDAQYNNSARMAGFDRVAFARRWREVSETARARRPCHIGVAYGPGPRHRLDIFPGEGRAASTEIFLHGGYWYLNDKSDFSYIADGLAPHGVTTVILNYPQLPLVTLSELVESCRMAVRWIVRNVDRYGGTPDRLHISGHSAGGHLVAMLMATDWPAADARLQGNVFAGACAISGVYDLEPIRRSYLNAHLRLTEAEAASNSPIDLAPRQSCPMRVMLGDRESDEFHRQSRALVEKWAIPGWAPELAVPEGDHFSIRTDLGSPETRMTAELLRGR